MRKNKLKILSPDMDYRLLAVTILMVVLGLIAVADASAPSALSNFSDKYYFVKQQLVWAAVGLVALIIGQAVNYNFYKKLTIPVFAVVLASLVLVLFPTFSNESYSAKRWLSIGPVNFQPSEFSKIALIFYIAKLNENLKRIIAYFIPLILYAGLIMLEPDLGTTLVLVFIFFSQIFVAGIDLKYIILSFLTTSGLGLLTVITSQYRRARLMTFIEQTSDPLGSGYHIRQILLSLGSGGLLGVGLGESRQKYLFLPEVATDSIFAVIGEEVGFVGASFVMLILVYFLYRCVRIALTTKDEYAKILSVGIIAWVAGQAFLNIGSVVALVPLTGIPLPFFSYGGSSLVTLLFATGILLNISKNAKS